MNRRTVKARLSGLVWTLATVVASGVLVALPAKAASASVLQAQFQDKLVERVDLTKPPTLPCLPFTVSVPAGFSPDELRVLAVTGGFGGEVPRLSPTQWCLNLPIYNDQQTYTFLLGHIGTSRGSYGSYPAWETISSSEPIQVRIQPEMAVDAILNEMDLATSYYATAVGDLEVCYELGVGYPSNALFKSTEPDVTAACLAGSTARRAMLVQVLATVGVYELASRIDMILTRALRHAATNPRPTPSPTPPPSTDPTPPPTARELELVQLADRIQRQTRGLLTPAQANAAARQCVVEEDSLAAAAGGSFVSTTPCLEYALLLPGADAGAAAVHDETAIAGRPDWALLTYLSGRQKKDTVPNRRWYTAIKYREWCKPAPQARGVECDEYPYYTTVQGGPGASLREVPVAENQAEGRALQAMQDDTACGMAKDPSGARTEPGSGTAKFLVVPLAVERAHGRGYDGPPSLHVCGDARTIGGGSGDGGVAIS